MEDLIEDFYDNDCQFTNVQKKLRKICATIEEEYDSDIDDRILKYKEMLKSDKLTKVERQFMTLFVQEEMKKRYGLDMLFMRQRLGMTFEEICSKITDESKYLASELALYQHLYYLVLNMLCDSFEDFYDLDKESFQMNVEFYTKIYEIVNRDLWGFRKNPRIDYTLTELKNKFQIVNVKYHNGIAHCKLDFCGKYVIGIPVFITLPRDTLESFVKIPA